MLVMQCTMSMHSVDAHCRHFKELKSEFSNRFVCCCHCRYFVDFLATCPFGYSCVFLLLLLVRFFLFWFYCSMWHWLYGVHSCVFVISSCFSSFIWPLLHVIFIQFALKHLVSTVQLVHNPPANGFEISYASHRFQSMHTHCSACMLFLSIALPRYTLDRVCTLQCIALTMLPMLPLLLSAKHSVYPLVAVL